MIERRNFSKSIIEVTLQRIGAKVTKEVDAYLIGGGAMIFYGRKTATKDIDIVFSSHEDLQSFLEAAMNTGFKSVSNPGEEYKDIGAWVILEDAMGMRLDLFNNVVCNALELTASIVARAIHFRDFNSLNINLMSPEDIVLFKGITERESDLEDIRILAETGIEWSIVEEECLSQSGSGRWANLLLYKLDELKDRYGIRPRVEKLRDHADRYVLEETFKRILGDRELSFNEIQGIIKEGAGYSDSWTRGKLRLLEKNGFISSRRVGRRRFYKVE
jgi:hypothetical protein